MSSPVQRDFIAYAFARQTRGEQRDRGRFSSTLSGVPGVTCVDGEFEEGAARIERVNGRALLHPIHIELPKFQPTWQEVGAGLHPEPVGVDASGQDVMALVDTSTCKWRMMCGCGRVRYAQRTNNVERCRVCQSARRRKYKTEWQRKKRKQAKSSSASRVT